MAQQWAEVDLTRAFVAAIRETEVPLDQNAGGKPIAEWLDWVDRRLESSDPLTQGAEAIFVAVGAVNEWSYRD